MSLMQTYSKYDLYLRQWFGCFGIMELLDLYTCHYTHKGLGFPCGWISNLFAVLVLAS